jgi:hypothetical protein
MTSKRKQTDETVVPVLNVSDENITDVFVIMRKMEMTLPRVKTIYIIVTETELVVQIKFQ